MIPESVYGTEIKFRGNSSGGHHANLTSTANSDFQQLHFHNITEKVSIAPKTYYGKNTRMSCCICKPTRLSGFCHPQSSAQWKWRLRSPDDSSMVIFCRAITLLYPLHIDCARWISKKIKVQSQYLEDVPIVTCYMQQYELCTRSSSIKYKYVILKHSHLWPFTVASLKLRILIYLIILCFNLVKNLTKTVLSFFILLSVCVKIECINILY